MGAKLVFTKLSDVGVVVRCCATQKGRGNGCLHVRQATGEARRLEH
jgi:hypothetical protein